jgi:GT2 family glycosyltransferase
MKQANGKWVAFLDSDDIWEIEKLRIQLEDIKKNNNVVAHIVDVAIEPCDKSTSLFYLRGMIDEFRNLPLRERPLLDVLNTQFFTQGCLIKKEVLVTAGYFNESFTSSEDLDLLTRVALIGPFYVNCYRGARIRRRQSSERALSDSWLLDRTGYLFNWVQIYQNLLRHPQISSTEALEVRRRLGGVRCELFDEYKNKKEWRKGFGSLFRSIADDPGTRSAVRAGMHLVGAAGMYARLKTGKRIGVPLRRSELDQVRNIER